MIIMNNIGEVTEIIDKYECSKCGKVYLHVNILLNNNTPLVSCDNCGHQGSSSKRQYEQNNRGEYTYISNIVF